MKKSALFIVCLLTIGSISAQKISYIISFPNIAHHEASITLTVSGLTQKNAIFRMSRSSPGRYATHEFGKNIYDVRAFDKTGKEITISRIDGDVYEVPRHEGFVRVEYTLFANYPDGTYAGIDPESIHLNSPATYLWLKGADKAPIDVKFNIPSGKNWTISTQLKPGNDPTVFIARDLQYLMDSPVNIGQLNWKEWVMTNPDKKNYKIRLSLEANTSDTAVADLARKISKITKQAQAVYGELPPFDYNIYTFISAINPYVEGDGMEHRNSTVINLPMVLTDSTDLSVFAHEFFHCWNVERIRPKTLEPFNFEKSNMSNELWFAEGFTQYYGELLMNRCGFTGVDDYAAILTGLINTKENTPGAKRFSPIEMSRDAVFVDAGVAVDESNYKNMFTSYYTYGAALALALDLELRTSFKLSLDDYMTAVWKKFGFKELPYTVSGLEDVLTGLTGKSFSSAFFNKYIRGHEPFNYAPLLEKAGYKLIHPVAGRPWLGNLRFKDSNDLTFIGGTLIGTPFYNAGLDINDKILELDGKPVQSLTGLQEIIEQHKPGDKTSIRFKHRETTVNTEIVFAQNNAYQVISFEKEKLEVPAEIATFRKSWLEEKAGKD